MTKKIFALLFFMALIAFGCKDDSEVQNLQPITIFTFHAADNFESSASENWVIIHNSEGELIDYKSFESGETLTFETTKKITDNKLTITLLNLYLANGTTHVYDLKSYHAIDVGDEWTIHNPFTYSDTSNITGSFSFSLTGDNLQYVSLTDQHGNSFTGSGGGNSYTGNAEIHDNGGNYLLTAVDSGLPRYKFIETPQDQEHVDLDFQNLNDFDHIVDFSFPDCDNIFLMVEGRREEQEYSEPSYLTAYVFGRSGSSIKAGYIDLLSKYKTYLSLPYGEKIYTYFNQGSIPTAVSFPFNADFNITNKTISKFTYTTNNSLAYRTTSWTLRDGSNVIDWSVIAPGGDYKIGAMPDELTNLYPFLGSENLNYISTDFVTSGQSYDELIEHTYKGKATEILELYSVSL